MCRLPSANMRPPYPRNLSAAEWALVREALPELTDGRRRRWRVRLVIDPTIYLVCNRRLSRDYERRLQSAEALIELAILRLMLRHTTPTARKAAFTDRFLIVAVARRRRTCSLRGR